MSIESGLAILFAVLLVVETIAGWMFLYWVHMRQQQFAVRQDQLEDLIRSLSPSMVFKLEKEFGTKVAVGDQWEQEWNEDIQDAQDAVAPFQLFEKQEKPWQ